MHQNGSISAESTAPAKNDYATPPNVLGALQVVVPLLVALVAGWFALRRGRERRAKERERNRKKKEAAERRQFVEREAAAILKEAKANWRGHVRKCQDRAPDALVYVSPGPHATQLPSEDLTLTRALVMHYLRDGIFVTREEVVADDIKKVIEQDPSVNSAHLHPPKQYRVVFRFDPVDFAVIK